MSLSCIFFGLKKEVEEKKGGREERRKRRRQGKKKIWRFGCPRDNPVSAPVPSITQEGLRKGRLPR